VGPLHRPTAVAQAWQWQLIIKQYCALTYLRQSLFPEFNFGPICTQLCVLFLSAHPASRSFHPDLIDPLIFFPSVPLILIETGPLLARGESSKEVGESFILHPVFLSFSSPSPSSPVI
jgi:hypothetical protein